MFRREKTISIAAPLEVVFQYVADIRRHGEWGSQAWDITLEPDPQQGPGTTFAGSALTRLFGRSLTRIKASEAPVRFVSDCLGDGGPSLLVDVPGPRRRGHTAALPDGTAKGGHGGCA